MTALDEPFLAAIRERRLSVQSCTACGWDNLPPRMRCPRCGETAFTWREASGKAWLRSFVVQHRSPPEHAGRVPYVYALVRLEEGPTIVSNIVDANPHDLGVGLELRATFQRRDKEGMIWPEFTPIRDADE